jgi:FkbM family methyltransferase
MLSRPMNPTSSRGARTTVSWVARAAADVMGTLPPGMGQHALARRLAGRLQRSGARRACQRMVGGAALDLDLTDRIQAEAFLTRRYEPGVVQLIASRLSQDDTFFDVGANVGLVSFTVSAIAPGIRIYAFEPHPANVAMWKRNHQLNPGIDASIEGCAVGAKEGCARLEVGDESGWHHITTAPSRRGMDVPMITLDGYAERHGIAAISVLKLDIEGHEPLALHGARRLLQELRIGCVVCELNDFHLARTGSSREAVIGYLKAHGYSASPISPVGAQRLRRSDPNPSDLVFEPGT